MALRSCVLCSLAKRSSALVARGRLVALDFAEARTWVVFLFAWFEKKRAIFCRDIQYASELCVKSRMSSLSRAKTNLDLEDLQSHIFSGIQDRHCP
jgi:hypothetical protein